MKNCENCRKKSKCSRAAKVEMCCLHSEKENRICQRCGSHSMIEEHHIFGAANRKRSDRDGLTIDLCNDCHRNAKDSAHASGAFTRCLHRVGQTVYEQAFGEGTFLKEYGRNYI